eukprot:jgi/Ulvmu1/1509/UM011_0239.1
MIRVRLGMVEAVRVTLTLLLPPDRVQVQLSCQLVIGLSITVQQAQVEPDSHARVTNAELQEPVMHKTLACDIKPCIGLRGRADTEKNPPIQTEPCVLETVRVLASHKPTSTCAWQVDTSVNGSNQHSTTECELRNKRQSESALTSVDAKIACFRADHVYNHVALGPDDGNAGTTGTDRVPQDLMNYVPSPNMSESVGVDQGKTWLNVVGKRKSRPSDSTMDMSMQLHSTCLEEPCLAKHEQNEKLVLLSKKHCIALTTPHVPASEAADTPPVSDGTCEARSSPCVNMSPYRMPRLYRDVMGSSSTLPAVKMDCCRVSASGRGTSLTTKATHILKEPWCQDTKSNNGGGPQETTDCICHKLLEDSNCHLRHAVLHPKQPGSFRAPGLRKIRRAEP